MVKLPPYAHVPGQNARHAEGAFDAICATAVGDPAALERSAAWRAGLEWLDRGYFWEAHEAMEAVWQALPVNSAERRLVRAMIQAANAGLKARMRQMRAVARLVAEARQLLADARLGGDARLMGLSQAEALARIEAVSA